MAPLRKTGRVLRNPTHTFYLEHMPFQIQPFLIAPVLPGETLKNATIQSRAVTDPILNKVIGWWLEYFVFYVKHRDLDGRADFTEMMLDPVKDMSSYNASASVPNHHYAGAIDWTALCLKRVVETYFRDEGVASSTYQINSMPCAAVNDQGWLDSAILKDDYVTSDTTLVVGGDDTITGSEVSKLLNMWELQRAHNMTDMTYEEFLATYTGRQPRIETHRPELLRHIREWQYPSNTISPTDGSAKSAISWAVQDRIDKDRYFAEPGFIFGVTVARPKVYFKNTDGSMVDMLQSALSWLPALMKDDPATSLTLQAHTAGPLATIITDTDGYIVDVKDLFLYGDQFVNVAKSGTGLNMVSLPNAALTNKDFPSDTDVDNLFVGATDAVRQVRQDGVIRFNILTSLQDSTPPHGIGTSAA